MCIRDRFHIDRVGKILLLCGKRIFPLIWKTSEEVQGLCRLRLTDHVGVLGKVSPSLLCRLYGFHSSSGDVVPETQHQSRFIRVRVVDESGPLMQAGEVVGKQKVTGLKLEGEFVIVALCDFFKGCLLYTSPSPRDATLSRMPSSA